MDEQRFLKPERVAYLLSVSRTKVYELMRSGRLGSVLIGGSRRVPREALDDFVARVIKESAA